MIARRVICLLLGCAAFNTGAQTFITMGRLFTTPSERAQLDQVRNSGAAMAPGGHGGVTGSGAGGWTAGAVGGGGNAGAIAPMAAGGPGAGGGAGPAGASRSGVAGSDAATAAPEPVRLTGMIRRSNGQTTVFVNNEEHAARPTGQGTAARVQVEGGRTVVLKPGQSYDPSTGEIRETGR